jgi:hypothetical protein
MRRILAVGLVSLMTFTSAASAADLTMPVKAPPPAEAPIVAVDWWPWLLFIPAGLCIATAVSNADFFCGHKKHQECTSAGGCFDVD